MSNVTHRTYYWDFFGPRAEPTAAHFARHLRGFLEQHGISDLKVVSVVTTPLHHAVGVETPPQHWQQIEKALRPRRYG